MELSAKADSGGLFLMNSEYRNPSLTVDIIIEAEGGGIVLIERKNEPLGLALPGGFVDEGETLEEAARREALEETALECELTELLYAYSEPARDPRHHTVSVVFIAKARGVPRAGDDAREAGIFDPENPGTTLVFDHEIILKDYLLFRKKGIRPNPGDGASRRMP